MSSSARAWMVAASIATVEALKYQGFARWNYTMIRCLQQHAKNNIRSRSQAKRLSSSTPNFKMLSRDVEELKQTEDSLKKVMYLNCWGPN